MQREDTYRRAGGDPGLMAIGVCRRLVLPFCLIYGLDFQPDRIHWHVGNTLSGLRREHPIPLFRQPISLRGLTERSLAHLISASACAFKTIK